MAFWNDAFTLEPKRSYNFVMSIAGQNQSIENYVIKKVKKPSFQTGKIEVQFLNHYFFYPGKTKWEPVEVTIIDNITPNGSQAFLEMLEQSGYRAPEGPVEPGLPTAQTISKRKSILALGQPTIKQMDPDGNLVEEVVLMNAWIENVEFGELDHESEEVMNITLTMAYDFPIFKIKLPQDRILPSNAR